MKVSVSAKGLFWSAFCVGLSLAVIDSPKSNSALANPVVISQQVDQVKVPPFYVNVTLTEKARLRLASPKETIVVSASMSGAPKKNSTVKVNETGSVDLTSRQVELPRAGRAQFNNLTIPAATLNQLDSQDYSVNVNVYSGRRSSQDNLLSCDFFDGKISKIQPGISLKCGLIGEYDSQRIDSANNPNTKQPSRSPDTVRALW